MTRHIVRALPLTLALLIVALGTARAQPAGYQVLHRFQIEGAGPEAPILQARDGRLYGTTTHGGQAGHGSIFRLDPDGHGGLTLVTVAFFQGAGDGGSPSTGLTDGGAGVLYGTTATGGALNNGVLFGFNVTTSQLNVILNFDSAGGSGTTPMGRPALSNEGTLFGSTFSGGVGGGGTVYRRFSYGGIEVFSSFDGTNGSGPVGDLAVAADGSVYGVTKYGPGPLGSGYGTVFRVMPDGTQTVLHAFEPDERAFPTGGLILGADRRVYGTTAGISGRGSLFRIDPADPGSFETLHFFGNAADGVSPSGALAQTAAGSIYGTTSAGGPGDAGTVFKWDPADAYTVVSGMPDLAMRPIGGVTAADDGNLYVTPSSGGPNGRGSIVRLNPGGTASTVHQFSGALDGRNPWGPPTLASDGNLYGATWRGGQFDAGTVYRMTPAGVTTIVHSFSRFDGAQPDSALVEGPDGALYGTTRGWAIQDGNPAVGPGTVYRITTAGAFNTVRYLTFPPPFVGVYGTGHGDALAVGDQGTLLLADWANTNFGDFAKIYAVAADGSSLSVLHTFDPTIIRLSGLVRASDGWFYGTALASDAHTGTVFRIDSAGTYQELSQGQVGMERGGLVQAADGLLYGPALDNAVFSVDPGLGTVIRYPLPEGARPVGRLIEAPDGFLYGATEIGGVLDGVFVQHGTIYRFDRASGNVTAVHVFDGFNGDVPFGGVTVGADGALYGTALEGGDSVNGGGGVAFRFVPEASATRIVVLDFPVVGYGRTAQVSAELTARTHPLRSETLEFLANGIRLGTAVTGADGRAVLRADFSGIDAGRYDTGLTVRFAGDAAYAATEATGGFQITPVLPTIVWPAPAPIVVGTPLGPAQLNATSNVPGIFLYSPGAGAVLPESAGYPLRADFTPFDTVNYYTASTTTAIDITGPPTTTTVLVFPGDPGWFAYEPGGSFAAVTAANPGSGTGSLELRNAGGMSSAFIHELRAPGFGPVGQLTTLSFNWFIDAASSVALPPDVALRVYDVDDPRSFFLHWDTCSPAAGCASYPAGVWQSVSLAGSLSVQPVGSNPTPETPADIPQDAPITGIHIRGNYAFGLNWRGFVDHLTIGFSVHHPITYEFEMVGTPSTKITPVVTWAAPSDISFGTPLGATQLNAVASVAGTFSYSPPDGTVLGTGPNQVLSTTFTPADPLTYQTVTVSVRLTVGPAATGLHWLLPSHMAAGDALTTIELTAEMFAGSRFLPSRCSYTPPPGTVPPAGPLTLIATCTPNDGNFAASTDTRSIVVSPILPPPAVRSARPDTIAVGGAPFDLVSDPTTQRLFVLDEQRDVKVVDLSSRTVVATLPADRPAGVALDPILRHLFVSAADGIRVFDVDSLSLLTTIALSNPIRIAIDPAAGLLWVARGDQVSEIDTATLVVRRSLPVFATALTLDGPRGRILVVHSGFPTMTILNASTGDVIGSVPVERTPVAVAVNGSSGEAYVVNRASHTVSVISVDGAVTDAIPMRGFPAGIAFDAERGRLYVSTDFGGFAIVDPVARAVVDRADSGIGPHGVAIDPANGLVLVANDISHDVSVYRDLSSTLAWPAPSPIVYGTPLASDQLHATATVPGVFAYAPPEGTVLASGVRTLGVEFRPADSTQYRTMSATTSLTVLKGTPVLDWLSPADVTAGTALGAAQLNATASVAGFFAYNPAAGTVLRPGPGQPLSVSFIPADAANFNQASASVAINVIASPLAVTVVSPNGGEKLFVGVNASVQWSASGGSSGQPSSFDVALSANGGTTYANIPGCVGVNGALRTCSWTPAAATTNGRLRVTAHDSSGSTAVDAADAIFTIAVGAPAITVTAPNTAVAWTVGTMQPVKWNHNLGGNSFARVELSRDAGISWETIASSVRSASATTGTLAWLVTGPVTTAAVVRVSWTSGPTNDLSNVPFAVVAPSVTVTAPNSSVSWRVGSVQNLRFAHNLGVGQPVKLEVSRDGGATWAAITTVTTTAATTGVVAWTVTSPPTARARIRASWAVDASVADASDVNFIVTPRITVTAPNTAVTWGAGSTRTVTWTHNLPVGETVSIDFSPDAGVTWVLVATGVPNAGATTGTYTGTMPSTVTALGLIRVSPTSDPMSGDAGNVPFTLAAPIVNVTAPNTNVNWAIGTAHAINWTHNLGTNGSMQIELSRNAGISWEVVAAAVLNSANTTGTFNWIVTGPATSGAQIRVRWAAAAAVQDVSNVSFRIQ